MGLKEECGVLLLIGNYQDADEVMNDLMGAKSSVKPETKNFISFSVKCRRASCAIRTTSLVDIVDAIGFINP